MNFVTLLLNNWQYIAIALLSAALYGLWQYMGIVSKDRDAAVSLSNQLKSELSVAKASIKTLEESVKTQNEKVDDFKKAGDKKFEENKENLAKAETEATTVRSRAETILKKQPAEDATACINANNLFNEEIKNER